MNHRINNFNLKNILIIWTFLTILLVFLGLLVFTYGINAKKYIVLSNIINIILFFFLFIFKNNIENVITRFINESSNYFYNIKYHFEKIIGLNIILFLIIFSIVIIYYSLFDVNKYRIIIEEDGVIEYGSAIFWFLSAIILFFYTIKIAKRKINKYQLLSNIMLIIFFVVCCGEEISWGQRIIGIETPKLLGQVNVQNEITLHNIGSISVFSNVFFLLTVVFFLYVPFLIKKNSRIKDVLYFIDFPVPNRYAIYVYVGSLFVWIFVGLRFGTLGFHPFTFYPEQYYTQMDDEIFEFLAAYSFLCFSILNITKQITLINRYRRRPGHSEQTP